MKKTYLVLLAFIFTAVAACKDDIKTAPCIDNLVGKYHVVETCYYGSKKEEYTVTISKVPSYSGRLIFSGLTSDPIQVDVNCGSGSIFYKESSQAGNTNSYLSLSGSFTISDSTRITLERYYATKFPSPPCNIYMVKN